MATAYSSEVAVGSYNRIRLRVEYSGTSASCHIEFRRTSTWTDTWGDDAASITFNGTTQSAPYWYSGTVGTSWIEIASASGFTVPISGGTFSWSFNNPMSQSVLGCSGSITIAAQVTAPTGLSVSNIKAYGNGFSGVVSVTGWGGAGSSSSRYRELQVWTYDPNTLALPRRWKTAVGDTLSSTITTSNNSNGELNIQPNTRYTLGIYASNGTLDTGSVRVGDYVTLGSSPSYVVERVGSDYAVISYSVASDGGFYDKTLQYSIDRGRTWLNITTISGGAATSGEYTISNLSPGVNYGLILRNMTSAGESQGVVIIHFQVGGFGGLCSVGGEAVKFTSALGSVNGVATKIQNGLGSISGIATKIK